MTKMIKKQYSLFLWFFFILLHCYSVINEKIEYVTWANSDFCIIKNNHKYGLFNKKDGIVIGCNYDNISILNNETIWVINEYTAENNFFSLKHLGLINLKKKQVILYSSEMNTDDLSYFYYDKKVEYQSIKYYDSNYIIGKKNDQYGIINLHNEIIISFEYDFIYYSFDIYYILYKGTNLLIYSNKTKKLKAVSLPKELQEISIKQKEPLHFNIYTFLSNQVLIYSKELQKWSFLESTNDSISINFKYDYLSPFNSYTLALKEGKWGVLHKKEIIIPFIYENMNYLNVYFSYEYQNINWTLKYDWYCSFVQYIQQMKSKSLIVQKNSKWGMINFKGEVLIPFIYDDIFFLDKKHIFVKKEGKWGMMDNYKLKVNHFYENINFNKNYTKENMLIINMGDANYKYRIPKKYQYNNIINKL